MDAEISEVQDCEQIFWNGSKKSGDQRSIITKFSQEDKYSIKSSKVQIDYFGREKCQGFHGDDHKYNGGHGYSWG